MFSIFTRYKQLPTGIMMLHIFGKFLAGLGIGLLLGVYITDVDWMTWGWVAIVLSLFVQMPALFRIVSMKAAEKAREEMREDKV